jgi:hypothetical protein
MADNQEGIRVSHDEKYSKGIPTKNQLEYLKTLQNEVVRCKREEGQNFKRVCRDLIAEYKAIFEANRTGFTGDITQKPV